MTSPLTFHTMTRLAFAALFFLALAGASDEALAKWVPVTFTNIESQPAGASVFLLGEDGSEKLLGLTPLKRAKLPRGQVKLKLTREGYAPFTATLEITRVRQTLVYPLQRTIVPGRIEVTSSPRFAGAAVELDGKAIGVIPTGQDVPPGRHHVVITRTDSTPGSDGLRWSRTVVSPLISS